MDPLMDDPSSEEDLDPDLMDDEEEGPGPGDGGSAAGGVVDEEHDAYALGDPDDPVERVLDVYLSEHLEDHL